jgi:hypothetical protein
MYTPEQIIKGIRNPGMIETEAWIVYSRLSRSVLGRNDPPLPELDWDNLLLLDACRYDLFAECSDLPGELDSRYSVASNTAEYVRKTFKGKQFPDIVCVTSTPKYYRPNVEDSFHDIIHVWEDDWDEEYQTVLPGVMNERVREAVDRYPNKRILAHYIPPHYPFIGEKGREIEAMVQFSGDIRQVNMESTPLWEGVKTGEYDRERVWDAYRENLEVTLPAVEEMLTELPGKTAVTADHGNVFGRFSELRVVGHPAEKHIKKLIEVPWHVSRNGERKEIVDGTAGDQTSEDVDSETVKDRLTDLGYLQ